MKKTTIAVVGIGGLAALWLLSKQSGAAASGGYSGGGSSEGSDGLSGLASGLFGNVTESLENIGSSGESLTGSMAGMTQALENMMRGISDASQAMSRTAVTMAETGTLGAETVKNVISVPNAFSKTFSNAGQNVAQFMNNFPTYVTKTDLTKPFDALSKIPEKSGLKGQANAGDAVKNFLSGRWW